MRRTVLLALLSMIALTALVMVYLAAQARRSEEGSPVGEPAMRPCRSTANCVTSGPGGAMAPFILAGEPLAGWAAVEEVVAEQPRTRIVERTPELLRAEVRSSLFGFVDDLELLLDPGAGRIDVRSASRVGRSDLGANRRRVDHLRRELRQAGIIESRVTSRSASP